jgi:two-component system chemotaxis response regulator CheB
MGDDGVAGLRALKEAGGLVLAQDEASSVVYGMPGMAASLGIADRVLTLAEIGEALVAAWHGGGR